MSVMSDNALKFYFNVEFVQPNYEAQHEIRDAQQHWQPPTLPNAVSPVAKTGWCKWEAASITQAQAPGRKNFQECSLFYDSERNFFLGVPFNCRKKSVELETRTNCARHGWRRLMFNHLESPANGNRISALVFDGAHNVLAAPGSQRWMPELIPQTYNYNLQEKVDGSTSLVGNLALFIGLAAFSGPFPEKPLDVALVLNAMRAFSPPNWITHNLKSEKAHSQGVIVSIRSIGGNDENLHAWAIPLDYVVKDFGGLKSVYLLNQFIGRHSQKSKIPFVEPKSPIFPSTSGRPCLLFGIAIS
ncbi:hypothetical protein AJ78_00823 [Emergomyces pasteurianus Ep9510]|uniref:Uncharacterized protein n=1 Tax=Emergomyces pasteurianus Ep9510 TaxID=1447872 RepID=A0A1J9PTI1_9EURO|nr:hypothetical protein AJ78_00823 [Emergomyces pasteurianus Ep9510]